MIAVTSDASKGRRPLPVAPMSDLAVVLPLPGRYEQLIGLES